MTEKRERMERERERERERDRNQANEVGWGESSHAIERLGKKKIWTNGKRSM